jgi:hypothetical protein
VRLYYRHVNQAERYKAVEVEMAAEKAFLYSGFSPELTNQPYFVVRRA